MSDRKEFKRLSLLRLREARVLHQNQLYDGAAYLAGYALELAFKARICRLLNLDEYPQTGDDFRSFKTHSFSVLVRLAGLQKQLEQQQQADLQFSSNWSLLVGVPATKGTPARQGWSEQWRYRTAQQTQQACAELLDALDDPKHGLVSWLKKKW